MSILQRLLNANPWLPLLLMFILAFFAPWLSEKDGAVLVMGVGWLGISVTLVMMGSYVVLKAFYLGKDNQSWLVFVILVYILAIIKFSIGGIGLVTVLLAPFAISWPNPEN